MANGNLNYRQLNFVLSYIRTGNATQAAIEAGYSAKTAKPIGSRLLTNVAVCAEIERRRSKIVERAEVSAEFVLSGLRRVAERCLAEDTFDASGANRALELVGKHLNMFIDRHEVGRAGDFSKLRAIEVREAAITGLLEQGVERDEAEMLVDAVMPDEGD